MPSIDRRAVVRRHNPAIHRPDPRAAVSVGNGGFAFTTDFTGLQTFAAEYEPTFPLGTQSEWGWHTYPPQDNLYPAAFRFRPYDVDGSRVGYANSGAGQEALYHYLRENPHRLHLAEIGLHLQNDLGAPIRPDDCRDIAQTLDLWTGLITSRFTVEGETVTVETCCHPAQDLLAIRVRSSRLRSGRVGIAFRFLPPPPSVTNWERVRTPGWGRDDAHETRVLHEDGRHVAWLRVLDNDRYRVDAQWEPAATLHARKPHAFTLFPAPGTNELALTCRFTPGSNGRSDPLPGVDETQRASAQHGADFWSGGAALDLSGSADARAPELERRVVLSQYLTAIQCAGTQPPQETGLTCNSWFGKAHLEMHWWHAVHFALWNRLPLLERSLGWYEKALPIARETARRQGYAGARWQKMVGPDGRDSPSPGTLLIWQQPHPIYYAELCWQARPTPETLRRFATIVAETAAFMASFAVWDGTRFVLGPPLIPVSENQPAESSRNPTFELAYWDWGLRTAQMWRERLGRPRDPDWDHVLSHLSALPEKNGVYLMQEGLDDTFTRFHYEHPALLGALGLLPAGKADRTTMEQTLVKVWETWDWNRKSWGWDFPLIAMTAARVGRPNLAVAALLLDTPRNAFLPNGHNYQAERLPVYLPGNGGLLAAVALMAGGWRGRDGAGDDAPGFPKTGGWTVGHENFVPML